MGAFSSSHRETEKWVGLGFPFGSPPLSIQAEDKTIKPSSCNPFQVYTPKSKGLCVSLPPSVLFFRPHKAKRQ